MSWYSWGFIRSSHSIRARSRRIGIVVKFYNHTLWLRYVRIHSDTVLSSTGALLMKAVMKNNFQQQMVHFRFGRIRLPDTCESAFTTLRNLLKLPKVSVNVQKLIHFWHDAQVEMAFITEIMLLA